MAYVVPLLKKFAIGVPRGNECTWFSFTTSNPYTLVPFTTGSLQVRTLIDLLGGSPPGSINSLAFNPMDLHWSVNLDPMLMWVELPTYPAVRAHGATDLC